MPLSRHSGPRLLPWRVGVALAIACFIAFAGQCVIALKIGQTGAFDYYNVLFDADSSEGVAIRAHGWSQDARSVVKVPNYIHPLINYMTMPFVRVAAIPVSKATGQDQVQVREAMALLVSPACTALAAFAFGVALIWLGLSPGAALGAAVLYTVSFSSLIFGAIPDHFSLGGLSIALLLAWLAYWLRQREPQRAPEPQRVSARGLAVWAVLAAFAAAVTITNIVVAFIVLAPLSVRREGFAGLVRSGLASAAIVVGVVAAAFLLAQALMVSAASFGLGPDARATPIISAEAKKMGKYTATSPASLATMGAEFGLHTVQAVVGLGVERQPPFNPGEPDTVRPISQSAWSPLRWMVGLVVAGLVGMGAYAGLGSRADSGLRIFSLAALLVIGINFVLHSVYGRLTFLYTQHWLLPVLFFMTLAILELRKFLRGPVVMGGLIAILAAVTVSNLYRVAEVISVARASVADHIKASPKS